ncbi:MAG TPA: hypothetical protein VEI82_08250 [Myxococcota bacterium]|nr:hypothetical protein [Myxococcota bacterium]
MRFGALLALVLAATTPPGSPQPGVIGYVEDGRFHPLLIVQAEQFGPFDPRTMSLAGGALRDAFADGGAEFPIQAERKYADPSGETAKYGLAPGRSYESLFFELSRGAKPRPASPPTPELEQSFRRFLADDERSSAMRILYATDLDGDGKKELWIAYRLPSGERGRMVWEQRAAAGAWVELADRCYRCALGRGLE